LIDAFHAVVPEAAQLRAGDIPLTGFRWREPDGLDDAGNRVLLHAHLREREAVDDVLAREIDDDGFADWQIEASVDDEVVLADGFVAIEAQRVVRGDESNVRAPEDAVRPRVVHIPRELLRDNAHDRRLSLLRRRGIDVPGPEGNREEREEDRS